MSGCCAANCSNSKKKGFRVFRFPRDPDRKEIWVRNCKRENWAPTLHSVLCEAHFDESQYEKHRADHWRKLKPNAVPTIFNTTDAPKRVNIEKKAIYELRPENRNNDIKENNSQDDKYENSLLCISKRELIEMVHSLHEDEQTLMKELDEIQSMVTEMKTKCTPKSKPFQSTSTTETTLSSIENK